MERVLRWVCVLVWGMFLLLVPEWVDSQTIPSVVENPWVKALLRTLERFENKELVIKKEEVAKSFEEILEWRVKNPVTPFEKSPQYPSVMKDRFKALPETLVADRPLSVGGKMLMVAAFYDRLEEVQKVVGTPEASAIEKGLRLPLFMDLGAGQNEAKKVNAKRIESTALLKGYSLFFSWSWPFCCLEEMHVPKK